MNAAVQKSFDALESSLAALIDSVASYNPSPAAALSVIAADDTLSESLDQLSAHQQSYQKILSLREISASLDAQLTELLSSLADARTELSTVPWTVFDEGARGVEYGDLLSYARKISKYSRPVQSSRPSGSGGGRGGGGEEEGGEEEVAGGGEGQRALPLGLSEEDVSALDPSAQVQFTPWPSEEVMKRGSLCQMGYEEELKAKGLPAPVPVPVVEHQGLNGQGAVEEGNGERVESVDAVVLAQAGMNHRPVQRHQQQQQQQQSVGISLSLDLYDPEED